MPTTRTGYIKVKNASSMNIKYITINHKYSDVYKELLSWPENLAPGAEVPQGQAVKYNTGFLTTGVDWWVIMFADEKGNVYYSDPNNFRGIIDFFEKALTVASGVIGGIALADPEPATKAAGLAISGAANILFNSESTSGFKRHMLTDEDENKDTYFIIKDNGEITITSPSGTSETVYSKRS